MEANCQVSRIEKAATKEELAVTQTARLAVFGMGCPNCAARVRNSLISLTGVVEAAVDHVTGTADVVFNPKLVGLEGMLAAVARAGNDGKHNYRAASINQEGGRGQRHSHGAVTAQHLPRRRERLSGALFRRRGS